MSMRLKGRIALITGGGTGIGAAMARRFAAAGARVVVTGRRLEPLQHIAEQIGGLALAVDVRDSGAMGSAVRQTVDQWGGLDIVVANAGIITEGDVLTLQDDAWQTTLDINLTGVTRTLRAALPALAKSTKAAILVISSVAGLMGVPQGAAYSATKAAVIGLTKSMAVDYGPRGIRVNALCPGWVHTPMSDDEMAALAEEKGITVEAAVDAVTRHLPLKRMAAPEEIAACAEFLVSDDASFVTGAVLVADGGGCVVDVGTLAFME
jgi:meso-butanediol dehydrogenase / (S,S)-butanediol dehydrogenase / diacetyl reductase